MVVAETAGLISRIESELEHVAELVNGLAIEVRLLEDRVARVERARVGRGG